MGTRLRKARGSPKKLSLRTGGGVRKAIYLTLLNAFVQSMGTSQIISMSTHVKWHV